MLEVQALVTLLRFHQARLAVLRADPDQGSVTLEKVVITALMVGIAVAVGAILLNKATTSANNIQTP